MVFLVLLLLPALVALGFLAFGGTRVTFKEFLVQLAAMLVYTGICCGVIYWRNTTDYESINGQVTSKKMERVSCRHPYCCMYCSREVCSGSGNSRSCHSEQYCCMTCYDHPFDQDWNVYTNVQRSYSIDTVDRQGLVEPPRWTRVRVGEPVSWEHAYENYIKASPGSLFKRDTREDQKNFPIPAYPLKIYDYWRLDRLVQVGVALPEAAVWNQKLAELDGELGPTKQANVVMVVVADQPEEYFYALEAAWTGGKKNDVVVVVGVDKAGHVRWANVMAWTYNDLVRVEIRDGIVKDGVIEPDRTLGLVRTSVLNHFQRRHMKDFKYLQASITPTGTQYLIAILIGTLISVGLGVLMYKNDVFGDEPSNRYRR